MHDPDPVDMIFQPDEMTISEVDEAWTKEELLAQVGMFYLKDIVGILEIKSEDVKTFAETHADIAWSEYGIRKVWNHWAVRMKLFVKTYKNHLAKPHQDIPKDWDGNTLARSDGLFLLQDVCKYIPFSSYQIRYQANKLQNARAVMGVWKHERINRYVVDMPTFRPCLKSWWQGDYGN
jgi:hypothetical protein